MNVEAINHLGVARNSDKQCNMVQSDFHGRATPIKIGPQSMPCPRPVWRFQRLRGKAVKISHVPGTQTQGISSGWPSHGSYGLPSCSVGAIMLYMGHVTDMVVAVVLHMDVAHMVLHPGLEVACNAEYTAKKR